MKAEGFIFIIPHGVWDIICGIDEGFIPAFLIGVFFKASFWERETESPAHKSLLQGITGETYDGYYRL